MKLSEAITIANSVDAGKWVKFDEFFPGVSFKIRPIGNHDFRRLMFVEVDGKQDQSTESARGAYFDVTAKKNSRVIAETIVSDWSGFEDDDGNALPFSIERALVLFGHEPLEALRDRIIEYATKIRDDAFKAEETDAKN